MPRGQNKEFKEKQGRLKKNTEEARELGRKGGPKSAEARRKSRTYREIFNEIKDELVKTKGGKKITLQEAAVQAVYKKAISGDINAMKLLLSMAGELDSNMQDFNQSINIVFSSKETADNFKTIVQRGINK